MLFLILLLSLVLVAFLVDSASLEVVSSTPDSQDVVVLPNPAQSLVATHPLPMLG